MTTNFDTEQTYGDLTSVLMFAFEQMMKGIDTCLPGVVESYDASTKRARVKPALRLLSTEGLSIEQASIVNVPVLFPSFGGYALLGTLKSGDAVLLLFSQRGISQFKQTFGAVDPDETSFFSRSDAICVPGFGALSVVPAGSGISLQSEDGQQAVAISPSKIEVKSTGVVEVNAPTLKVTSPGAVEVNAPSLKITSPGSITISSANSTMTGNVKITGTLTVVGDIVLNGVSLAAHRHVSQDSARPGYTGVPTV